MYLVSRLMRPKGYVRYKRAANLGSRYAFTWVPLTTVPHPRTQLRQGSIAFGPQHPAAHGILRLQLQLSGEVLRWLDPQFGFLHRGSEKLMENRNSLQSLPYFDRFDYVANLFQEHAYCLAVESLYQIPTTLTASVQLLRLFFDEISRMLNHLLTLSATALDMSVMGPIFWAFEEREVLMEICERASGARMHTALYRPFGFDHTALSLQLMQDVAQFLTRCSRSLAGAFLGLLNNRSFKSRLSFIGQVNLAKASAYGITGLIARSSGMLYDLRFQARQSYGLYRLLSFRTFLGRRGDNYDRFLIRVKETAEGFRLLTQLLYLLYPALGSASLSAHPTPTPVVLHRQAGFKAASYPLANDICMGWDLWQPSLLSLFISKHYMGVPDGAGVGRRSFGVLELESWAQRGKFVSMEALISHFRQASEGWPLTSGFTYQAVESPKGEVGVTLISSGSSRPVRVKLRTPVSHNMNLIPSIAVGVTFADFVATFCSLDIVMGEIDR